MSTELIQPVDVLGASMQLRSGNEASVDAPFFRYQVECLGPDGQIKWTEDITNLVTTAGKNFLIDTVFKGSAYTAAWYLGLKGTGTPAAGDTLASHATWSEINPYTGNRKAITFGTTSGGSNQASSVGFTITADMSVVGAFVASVATGTSGTLYSAGDFASARSVLIGDTLNVTLTVSAT